MFSQETKTNTDVVLSVDVGTSNVKCYAYDRFANVIGKAEDKIPHLHLDDGKFEIHPDVLWEKFKDVINSCLLSSRLKASQVSCMGISTQRGTFLTWDRETGEPFHNFISWMDKRSRIICDRWNSSLLMIFLSTIRFSTTMVLTRLYWILEHIPKIRQKSAQNKAMFGTMDTWLLWKLTGRQMHATDGSNACVTGFFDPFKMQWSSWILKFFSIPKNILPDVKNTSDIFGETLPNLFGSSIPVCCLVGDQQASMFGARCFEKYDANCTMGTGSFLCLNTGDSPSFAYPGIFPLVGWTIDSRTTYIAECGVHDTGPAMTWMQRLGFFQDLQETSSVAQSVEDAGGVYFLPTTNPFMASSKVKFAFVDISVYTTKANLVRSVLESLAFQTGLLFDAACKVYGKKTNVVRMCGGVSKNDFVMQILSDITCQRLERLQHCETASLGAAFLAGLGHGIWKIHDFKDIERDSDIFLPNELCHSSLNTFGNWKTILELGSFRTPFYYHL